MGPGLVAGLPWLTRTTLVVALALAFVTLCLGHSVGLHRGVIHRTYRAHPVVRGALVYLTVLGGLGGPLSWIRLHAVRDFWQNRPDCPRYFAYGHSIGRDFVWNLHLRFEPADGRADAKLRNRSGQYFWNPQGTGADRRAAFRGRTGDRARRRSRSSP